MTGFGKAQKITDYMNNLEKRANLAVQDEVPDDATNRANFSNQLIMSIENLLSPEFISSPEHVKKLQDMFNVYVYGEDRLEVDGKFGPKTNQALIDYKGVRRYWPAKNDAVDIDPRVSEALYKRRKEDEAYRENPPKFDLKRSDKY